jgi:tRNA dimethylallyltransferase
MAAVQPALIAIVGPTASGKSELALELARARGGEIISCDSLQVYRGMDIGSAKPTAEERALVRHHLIDVAEPDHDFSAAEYARQARAALRDVAARGRLPIVVGGTGLYLRALLAGLFTGPSRNAAFRERVEALAARFGRPRIHRWLRQVDPLAASRIDPNDLVRSVRALEVFAASRSPISQHQVAATEPLTGFRVGVFVLDPHRDVLRDRVAARTEAMLAAGLLDEVRRLLARFPPGLRPFRAIGYRQAADVLRGAMDVESARRDMVTATMQYAKRQRTWFRHQAEAEWFATATEARARIDAWLEEVA